MMQFLCSTRKEACESDKNYKTGHPYKRRRRQATSWKKVFAKGLSEKGLLSKVCKELLKLNNKMNNSIKNGQRPKQIPHIKIYRWQGKKKTNKTPKKPPPKPT